MRMKQKLFTLFLALAANVGTIFSSNEVDGIWYDFDESNNTAAVTYSSDGSQYSNAVTIPATVSYNGITYSVTSIGDAAFINCTGLTSVTIPNSVTSIGESAFSECYNLITVNMFKGVTNIGAWAFLKCQRLTTIEIPQSVISIGEQAFADCFGLTSITIPNSVTNIGDLTFCNCSSLTSITIPKSVTSIGNRIFYGCGRLTSIIVENGNHIYDSRNNCNAIIDTSSKTLIEGCKNSIIPNSVTSIGNEAFEGCTGLTSITIPKSVTYIGEFAFAYCSSLASVTIGNGVTSIGMFAFANCNLKNIELGASVGHIGLFAFSDNLVFDESGYNPLRDADGNKQYTIKTIACYNPIPPIVERDQWGGELFGYDDPYSSIILYVSSDCITAYKNLDAWEKFDIRAIEAKESDVSNLQIETGSTSVAVAWPAVEGAATYELVIRDKDGNIICTLVFDAQGQLTQIAFSAPSRDGAPQQTQASGFSFTVTSLEQGTSYDLTITAKDGNGKTLDEKKQSFHTDWAEAIDEVANSEGVSHKILRNGQVLIQRGDKLYTLQGQEVK